MRAYHVNFWSAERAHAIGCDIAAEDERGLLDGFARAGRYALELRSKSAPASSEWAGCGPTAIELAWLAFVCGPAWLFVAASYWFG